MALIDVIKCQMTDTELCVKFQSEDLMIGSQLIVYPSQVAFFVKGGKICDKFEAGTYTLSTDNIPLLNKLINLPFGKEAPFQAEVWFINLTAKLDMKWGTPIPIQLEDPKYGVIVPIRAFGQYGLRVDEPECFLKNLIGNAPAFSTDKVDAYFKGKLITQLNSLIAQKIALDKVSILEINAHLVSLSDFCNEKTNEVFAKYGLRLEEFNIMSINVPDDDISVQKLKEAKDTAARLRITGKDVYQMERSFDVLEKAASNEGVGGQMVAMGAGLGTGLGVGTQIGNMAGNIINTNPLTPPPIPTEKLFFVYLNGEQIGGQSVSMIADMVSKGLITGATLVWTSSMANWMPASQVAELTGLFMSPPPIPQV